MMEKQLEEQLDSDSRYRSDSQNSDNGEDTQLLKKGKEDKSDLYIEPITSHDEIVDSNILLGFSSELDFGLSQESHFPWFYHVFLSFAWFFIILVFFTLLRFGWSLLWMPLLVVIMPAQIVDIAGDDAKGISLGATLLAGSFSSLICAPIFGTLSDRCKNPLGRRRPYMIWGTIIATISLFTMSLSRSLTVYILAFLVLSTANNMIVAPYSALVPDVVPKLERGYASGLLGAMSMLGYLMGGFITLNMDIIGIFPTYLILIFFFVSSMMVTVYFIKEKVMTTVPPFEGFRETLISFFKPLKNYDFKLLFFTRFLMQMGSTTVQEYLQYYVKDAIPNYTVYGIEIAETPERAVSVLFITLLFSSLFSAIVSGSLSDRIGRRKIFVYVSGAIMSVICLLFSFTRSYQFDLILSILFGLGYGTFASIDWAMATDLLPAEAEFAKDMGVWSLAIVLPAIVAAPSAGIVLDIFQRVAPEINLGYSIIFIMAVIYYIFGNTMPHYSYKSRYLFCEAY